MRFGRILCMVAFVSATGSWAADLRDVTPVTDTILMVHFNEGHIDQALNEKDAKPYISKLDVKAAVIAENYSISSEDDPRFKSEQHPTKLGRKAKAVDTLSLFRPEKFVLDHWIYLTLPQALQHGCTYTLRVENLASNAPAFTFLFLENSLHSETIHVNQIGFTPDGPKYAYLSHWMGDLGGVNLDAYTGKPFHVIRVGDGATVFSGNVAKRKDLKTGAPQTSAPVDGTPFSPIKKANVPSNFTEADVSECDFSAFKTPGNYRVAVEGMGCSFTFAIDEDVYRKAYYVASRGLFFQRAGIEKEIEPGMNYPRDHHPDDGINTFEYDKNWRWIDKPDHGNKITPTGTLKVWGWYHDAGDWDGYPGHVNVPMCLLMLYDLAGEKFADGQVSNRYKSNTDKSWIDEGKNGIPDELDEASWLIQYYKRARAVGLKSGVTTGGVPGGYSGVDSCAGDASWKDTRALMFSAEDPATTYQYAAVAAWLAACLDKAAGGSSPDSAEWIKEAKESYAWSKANMRAGDEDKVIRQRALAALCLFRATKDAAYHEQFAADMQKDVSFQQGADGWYGPENWEYAAAIYALLPASFPGVNAELQKTFRTKVLDATEKKYIKTAADRGYRLGFDWFKMHQLGTFSTPILFEPAMAYKLTREKKYLDVMQTTASYCLGGNPMNMVWMTGLGQRSVKSPFHPDSWALFRFNSMVYDNEFLPGYVPYGSTDVDFFGPGFHFSGSENYSRSSAYPAVETWPLSETRFENRYSIAAGEFTITQNMAPSIFAYGFLCANAAAMKSPASITRPGVAMEFPKDAAVFKAGGDVALRVKTTANVDHVEYFYNEHYIGTADAPPFALTWHAAPQGEWLITAKAFDSAGKVSKPNDPAFKVDVKIRVDAAAPAVAVEKAEILNAPKNALIANTEWNLVASVLPLTASNQAAVWSSSDAAIASVNSQGVVVAKAPGKATITLKTTDGGRTSECQIQVASAKP